MGNLLEAYPTGMYSFCNSGSLRVYENTTVFNDKIDFAGYVSLVVQSSINITHVVVTYSSYRIDYYSIITVGASGTAAFPVLLGLLGVRADNTEAVDSVNVTVTATHHY
jgi:hypothetical protein